ncbi:hypothetical protein OEB96_02835 [Paraliomyxa miuraensis]|nr:hypothetical protein [Paraliomyxa miuraensis]
MARLAGARTSMLVALALLGACYPVGLGYRSLHEVDGEVVSSRPPPPSAYEAYLRARLALEQEPPALDDARFYIGHALEMDPGDPHLWATHAEIEERAGRVDEAMASARHALELRPGYPPAERVLTRLQPAGGG